MKATLTVDLDALGKNYAFLAEKVAPCACSAVVKANGYGLGIAPIAQTLWNAGNRLFFVAQLDEAIELRALLPEATIYVLNGLFAGEENIFAALDLVPCLNDGVQLALWQAHALCVQRQLPAILHVDTGLNRLGFNVRDFKALGAVKHLDLHYIISHLACADDPENEMNKHQRDLFISATQHFPQIKKSLAASDGIFCGTRFHFDLVRPGAALYGLNPRPGLDNPMRQVVRLQAPIIQLRTVDSDGTVGYGASARVTARQRLATIALGYADGFLRSLGNQAILYWGDHELPVLGRVSMDLITVDVSSLPEEALKVGDMLDIFSRYQTPDQLARKAGTIDYELFTTLGRRLERHYIEA